MHRSVAAALVAALALGVASCGGSEEPLTRAQLVRQIEVACREGSKAGRRVKRSSEPRALLIDRLVTGQRAAVEEIDDLNPAESVKADFEAFKQQMHARADLFARAGSHSGAALVRAMNAAEAEGIRITKQLLAAANRLGVKGCV
jgi:hypothetical protein